MNCKNLKIAFASFILAVAAVFAGASNIAAQTDNLKFDEALQAEFAAAMGGDAAALTRAMTRADKILAANPNDAETLVWRGSATAANAGKMFQSGNFREGAVAWQKGLAEMDKASELAPDSFTVRMVRGSTYLNAAKRIPDPAMAKDLRVKGIGDYEKILSFTDEKTIKIAASQKPRILKSLIETYDTERRQNQSRFLSCRTRQTRQIIFCSAPRRQV